MRAEHTKERKLFRGMILMLPIVLLFSYWPVILLGANETMNFEFSLPLIWLFMFGVFSLFWLVRERKWKDLTFKKSFGFLFPVFVSLSIIWSLNPVRGILTSGILWLIFIAGVSFYEFRAELDGEFWKRFWKVTFFAGSFSVFVLVLQCVLDLVGVGKETSLMCDGCVSEMFGFPHPNGFAIEPQFMGNLLLFPALVSGFFLMRKKVFKTKSLAILLFVFSLGIFLTFSRGAIYAFLIGLVTMILVEFFRRKNRRGGVLFIIVGLAFLFTLNMQGIFAAVGPTTDGYRDGIAKVLNHLSLGIIDIRESGEENGARQRGNNQEEAIGGAEQRGETSAEREGEAGAEREGEVGVEREEMAGNKVEEKQAEAEKPGVEEQVKAETAENKNGESKAEAKKTELEEKAEAIFDGYVEESTETRLKLSEAALEVFMRDGRTVLFGVGIGGAGEALCRAGLTSSPKEIIQNQYVSLLLETGIVGVSLMILTISLISAMGRKSKDALLVLTLAVSYGISIMFFAGLTNALQIYLLPVLIMTREKNEKT